MKSPVKKLTRRQSLKTLAGLSTGLMVAPLQASCLKPPKAKLGVALVGLGNYANLALGPALKQTQYCELVGLVTGTPEKENNWQQEYGVSPDHTYNYQNFDTIAKDEAIDIIYIVLPNFMHAEYTIRALKAGKHVICEKPMAMDAAECKAMIQTARQMRRKLQIGYRLFYEPHHLELVRQANESFEGGIKMMETSLGFNMARPGMWRIDKDKGGGGALMDLGPYTIQAARRAAGSNPLRVTAQGYTDNPDLFKGIYGTYSWQLEFEHSVISNSTASFSAYVDRYYVAKSNDYLELQPAYASNTQMAVRSRAGTQTFDAPEFQQAAQMDAFARNILDDTPVIASGEEGLIDMQIIGAIKQSLATGKTVAIDYS